MDLISGPPVWEWTVEKIQNRCRQLVSGMSLAAAREESRSEWERMELDDRVEGKAMNESSVQVENLVMDAEIGSLNHGVSNKTLKARAAANSR